MGAAKPIEPAHHRGGDAGSEHGRLAEVIVLDQHRSARRAGAVHVRRRVVVGLALILLLAVVIVAGGRVVATAGPEDPVAGHDVVAPGETLWGVATEHAPEGTDPRAYLDEIIQLNGFGSSSVPAWTVVLLPAR